MVMRHSFSQRLIDDDESIKKSLLFEIPALLGVRTWQFFSAMLPEVEQRRAFAASYIKRRRKRYTGFSKWVTRHIRDKLASYNLITLPTEEEVISQGTQLCREYILQRLRSADLLSPRIELLAAAKGLPSATEQLMATSGVEWSAPGNTVVTRELQAAGAHLELMYPELYDSLTNQLELTLTSESEAIHAFTAVSRHLYKGTITWGKVVAGLALAGALAADCVRQEKPEYVKHVLDAFTEVTKEHTAAWIVQQGGWGDVIHVCQTSNDASLLWAFSFIGATIGFSLTLLVTANV